MTKLCHCSIIVLFVLSSFYSTAQSFFHFEPSYSLTSSPELETKLKSAYENELLKLDDFRGEQLSFIKKRYESRHFFLMEMLTSGDFIVGTALNSYVDSIYYKLAGANSELDPNLCILISRSAIPNAFNTGDGFIVLNVGLLYRMENEGQLAFVIAHEAAHQMKNHVYKQMVALSELHTDKERNKQIDNILKSEYRVKTQLENFLLPGAMNSMRHSRQVEFEADSTGFIYHSTGGFQLSDAISLLQMLGLSDEEKYQGEIDYESLFALQNMPFKPSWIAPEAVSSLGTFAVKHDILEDSLKTHPDCDKRIEALERKFSKGAVQESDSSRITNFENFRLRAECELVEGQLLLENYGRAFHFALQLWRAHPELEYPVIRLSYILAKFGKFKKERTSGKYLSMSNRNYTDSYNATLNFLWKLNINDCAMLSYWFLREKKGNYKGTEIGYMSYIVTALSMENLEEVDALCKDYLNEFPEGFLKTSIVEVQNQIAIKPENK